jgi:hypothetical protein
VVKKNPESHREGADGPERIVINGLTEKIIGAAIEVHKVLGPGLLESAYEGHLAHELSLAKSPLNAKCHCRYRTSRFSSTAGIGSIS